MTRAAIPAAPVAFDGWSEHFDAYAPDYEQIAFDGAGLAHLGRREVDAIVGALGPNPGRVLDAGAGTGRISRVLDRAGWDVTALDASQAMLARLQSVLPHVRTVHGVLGRTLPLPDACVDAVVCLRVLKYVDDIDTALREFARVLRPGGVAAIEWTNRWSLARFGYGDAPVTLLRVPEAAAAMRAAGLEVTSRVAGPRLPHPVWERARGTGAARVASGAERAIATLSGGNRSTFGARSVMLVGMRR